MFLEATLKARHSVLAGPVQDQGLVAIRPLLMTNVGLNKSVRLEKTKMEENVEAYVTSFKNNFKHVWLLSILMSGCLNYNSKSSWKFVRSISSSGRNNIQDKSQAVPF